MAKKNRNKDHSHNPIKNRAQQENYHDFLSRSGYSPEGTVSYNSIGLMGSDQSYQDNNPGENKGEIRRKPIQHIIGDWLKANMVAIIVTAVVGGAICWFGGSMIQMKVDLARLDERVDIMKEEVSSMKLSAPTKNEIDSKIENLEEDINDSSLDITDLKSRMNDLEQYINDINR